MGLMKNKKQIALLLAISTLSGIVTPTLMNLNNIESFAYNNTAINLSEEEKIEFGIKKIVSFNYTTFFLKEDGTVWATGHNYFGQLGVGNFTNQTIPAKVIISDVKDIVCGDYYTVFIKKDGTVWVAGNNESGQLGTGNKVNQQTPIKLNISDVKHISYGDNKIIYAKNDGTVWVTGNNQFGQLGTGNTTNVNKFTKIEIDNVKKVFSVGTFSFFIKEDGTVWGCGSNHVGNLGVGNTTQQNIPVQVDISDVSDIISGSSHTMFIKTDGTIWATGSNSSGQLGIGTNTEQLSPIQVPITNVKKVICGFGNTIFLKNDNTVWVTGYNYYGDLGIGNNSNQLSLIKVNIDNVEDVFCGYYEIIFLKKDGTVWGSGLNSYGQLGIGTTINQNIPVQADVDNVSNVICAYYHNLFIRKDGTVWATGSNSSGQLGIGNKINQSTPVNITTFLYTTEELVLKAEQSKAQIDLDIAKTKVDNLSNSQEKTELLNRLNILQTELNNIKTATNLTLKAESTLLQSDFNVAQNAINLITDNKIKTELQSRLDNIKNQIIQDNDKYNKQLQDAISKIIKAEISLKDFDVVIAQTAINNLKESDSVSLQQRLDVLKEQIKLEQETLNYNKLLQEATDKVTKAENSKIDYDITVAQIAIDKLKPEDKSLLQEKIDNLKEQIKLEQEIINYNKLLQDATTKTAKAEETENNYDITIAKEAINKLKDIDKLPLQERIDILEYNILLEDANLKVLNAEELRTDTSISIAQVAVDKVPLREVQTFNLELVGKTQLQNKLDNLKLSIEEERYLQLLQEANNNVTTAESTKSLKDIKLAQMSIDRLKEIDKTPLQERLDNLKALILQEEKEIQDLKLATSKVEQAEVTKTQKYIDEAKALINSLKESEEKTSLLDRINAIEQQLITDNIKTWIYQADVYVKQAEALKREPYTTKAQTAIDKLPACEEKTLLQARLDKVKK